MKLLLLSAAMACGFLLTSSVAQDPAATPVRSIEDLLRGMPITEGLYSAQKPNPATCKVATEALSKVAVGRPIELKFALDKKMSAFYPNQLTLHIARSAPINHRHRLDQILVRFQFFMEENEALRPKFKQGFNGDLKGTIKKVEFGPEGQKVLLVVTLGDVTVP